ncbi:MAG: hypothetical protein WAM79_21310 [Candidatus Sulfotelmatobacter sp.]
MSFRSVFIAVVIAFALILAAFLLNRARPKVETEQPSAALVRASGKCAECHLRTQYSVVHEYEMSEHARKGVNCLDCHHVKPRARFTFSEHRLAGSKMTGYSALRQERELGFAKTRKNRNAGERLRVIGFLFWHRAYCNGPVSTFPQTGLASKPNLQLFS